MSEEKDKEEATVETAPKEDDQAENGELDALKQSIAEKDARIAELEGQATESKSAIDVAAADLAATTRTKDEAIAKYREAVKNMNPTIPAELIAGNTVEDIDASVEKGKGIVQAVVAANKPAAPARVPAGAPVRTELNLEGMTAREKIAAGINKRSAS